ncbi:type IV pilin-like G/H family protein [Argonema galeatum]|uniref:type IV pilin-like G/H family protein n=1 Tax=Argonema galeatum TaxID=2942762 RepID=UPI0020111052|nr:type IV pilin-like G/H family protein [Argonema galeatum]MCL1467277.1 pesticin [Argonema galeatum A003/A1]
MNIEFRVKWLLYILNKNKNRGFNIVTLIVVIFILGILAAIALESPHLGQAQKGKQAEAKQYVSTVNKGQQAYYTEFGKFVTTSDENAWNSLGFGIKTQTTNYKYSISPIGDGRNGVNVFAHNTPTNKGRKNYTGVVGLVSINTGDKTMQSIVCETKIAGDVPMPGEVTATEVKCGSNSDPVK